MYSVSLSDEAKEFFEEATAKLQERLDRCFEQPRFVKRIYQGRWASLTQAGAGIWGHSTLQTDAFGIELSDRTQPHK